MGVNLLAAHALRFKVQASGARLLAGLAVIALGVRAHLDGGRRRLGQGHDRGRRAVRLVARCGPR